MLSGDYDLYKEYVDVSYNHVLLFCKHLIKNLSYLLIFNLPIPQNVR